MQTIHMSILELPTTHPRVLRAYIILLLLLLLCLAPAGTKRSLLSKYFLSPGGDNRLYYRVINVEKFFLSVTSVHVRCKHTRARPRTHVPPATPAAVVSGYRIIRLRGSRRVRDDFVPHRTNAQ